VRLRAVPLRHRAAAQRTAVPRQVLGLPLSLAYFLGDIYWYCIPQRDYLIAFHHATMLACHYPVGSDAGGSKAERRPAEKGGGRRRRQHGRTRTGAALCGAGDALFAVRLSLLGYLCELSNPLMNWRWWLMQTLQCAPQTPRTAAPIRPDGR
jgi:hypothetical protein